MTRITPAFDNRDLARSLRQAARGWLGTRYAHMGVTQGDSPCAGGVDCTKLLALIFVDLGILSKVDTTYYGRDWFCQGDQEVVLQAFTEHLARYIVAQYQYQLLRYRDNMPLIIGDVLCLAVHRHGLCNHTVLWLDNNRFLHALEGPGVHIADWSSHWRNMTRFVFRIFGGQ